MAKSKSEPKVTEVKAIETDTAEITITRGKKTYTVLVYASADGINFQASSEDLSEPLEIDGPEYAELDESEDDS